MIILTAKLKAQEGKEPELEAALSELVEGVSANEPGVALYTLHVSDEDPSLYMMYEQYADGDAQKAHGATEHMAAFRDVAGSLLDGPMEIERYTLVTELER
ncbi:MAG TPA: putative quinol monooxygenase [Dehalococcoidia bacterium]|nr:putative quinol monooxygenase [Dehalococcoidia bacterium]